MKVLPHVMRNINEFNIPSGDPNGYEILYFGANLILMFEYRLSFDIKVKNSEEKIEVLIISRKHVPAWKTNANRQDMTIYYNKQGTRINDVFNPSISDAYAFILDNRSSSKEDSKTKKVEVTLVHTWQQEIKESQLKDKKVSDIKP
ncbi:MAG: hypothetical protein M3530_01460 [Thermoproteota archaeon]|nr:hypothetical protein [Thermoproteota archaeon]